MGGDEILVNVFLSTGNKHTTTSYNDTLTKTNNNDYKITTTNNDNGIITKINPENEKPKLITSDKSSMGSVANSNNSTDTATSTKGIMNNEDFIENANSTGTETFCISIEDETKCIPRPVYVKWVDLRIYLIKYMSEVIPNVLDGSLLKVNRCLYFMSICTPSSYFCMPFSEKYTTQNVTLMKHGRKYGYYHLTFIEDSSCQCKTKYQDLDYPWDTPPIIYSKLYEI